MVAMRGLAFVLGALGLALFLAGVLWAILPADGSCPDDPNLKGVACERHNYAVRLTRVMFVVGAGLVVEAAAVVLLMTHLARGKAPARKMPPPPPQQPGAPRNRFLDPPRPAAPPRNGKRPY